jgi:hypothetical protein
MEGYKCPKCYKIGLSISFLTNHFCYIQPINPFQTIKKIKINSLDTKKTLTDNILEPER